VLVVELLALPCICKTVLVSKTLLASPIDLRHDLTSSKKVASAGKGSFLS
jgi:hypothetical protein